VEITLDGFNDALKKLRENQFWENLSKTANNISEITAALDKPKELSEIVDNVHGFTKTAKDVAKSTQEVVIKVQNGEGSLGKLIVKDDLYLQLSSLLSKAETTLDDVNHYGILFHLDKGWQRLRARRLNLMQTLQSPQEFRNYFNDEIDSISTSITRVSMVLEKIEEECPCMSLWQNPEYVKVYAELIRRVAELDEYIRMYNQQAMDSKVKTTELLDCRMMQCIYE
jgi:phospholipid/cholesterol/gamma-HCH transport system substrate-binding protein